MSAYLSASSLLRPSPPSWLEALCQRLSSNDPSLQSVELNRELDDIFTHEVARSLQENRVATSLVLSFFSIVDDGAYIIATALGTNKNILKLQVRDLRNQREVNIFFEGLSQNAKLHEFSMRHCSICPRGVQSFGTFFRCHPCLQEIRLVDTQFGGRSFSELCRHLKYNGTLERLFLVNNELQQRDMESLKTLLLEMVGPLRELHLCENNVDDQAISVISEGLVRNQSISVLDLRSNSISELGGASIQGILVANHNLCVLGLANNELGNTGVAALSRGLRHSYCGLKSLNVSGNGCDSAVADSVAAMLRHNKRLAELNLSFNALGDCGASKIARSLTKNSSLQKLEMRKIGMSCVGAEAIGKYLPRFKHLKELVLTRNKVQRNGGVALLEGLRNNVNLEYLLLEEKMSETIAREIARYIRLNKAGRRAFRQDNKLPSALWGNIYGRFSCESDIVYYFVRAKPEVVNVAPADDQVAVLA